MSFTNLAVVADQMQKYWSPLFSKELRESLLLGSLINTDYSGEINAMGDQVKISQINAPNGEIRTAGIDDDSFNSEAMSLTQVTLTANKVAVASFKITDLAELQSQIGGQQSAIRDSLKFAVEKQINIYLKSLVSPSTSAPDHLINSVTDLNASQLSAVRLLAAQAKWAKEKGWIGLIDPSYMNDLLAAQTLTSSDYVGGDASIVAGQIANKRFGFTMYEDNSLTTDRALFFSPDFMNLAIQRQVRFKISDLHPLGQFGYLVSCDVIFGAALGIQGANKHVVVTSASSGSTL